MSRKLDLSGAYVSAIAQAQGQEDWLTRKEHSIHVGGYVNVWVCGYCWLSTRGPLDTAPFACSKCGEQLP